MRANNLEVQRRFGVIRGADADAASIASIVLELLIDAITALLFAAGTFNSFIFVPADL